MIGRVCRVGPLRDYCTGLVLPCERKSAEPIAAVTAPGRVAAQHQSLLHFLSQGGWPDETVLAKIREMVLPRIERHGAVQAWVIDDTQARPAFGRSHQYCNQSGKQDNRPVAVSLSLANHHASLPVAYRLYLPKCLAQDIGRRRKAGVPDEIAAMRRRLIVGIARSLPRCLCRATPTANKNWCRQS